MPSTKRRRARGAALAGGALLAATVAAPLGGCSQFPIGDTLGTSCASYTDEYQAELSASGQLAARIPSGTGDAAMALVLSQDALNRLFRELADVALPELAQSADVGGIPLGLSIRPALPLLQIGSADCVDCLDARVPFDLGLVLGGLDLPRGSGALSVRLPVGMEPVDARRTAFVARFQSAEVLQLELDLPSRVSGAFEAVEPIVSRALTALLQSRFEDVEIATLDSWEIGRGEVLLAARGPVVDHAAGTVTLALQSNLPVARGSQAPAASTLPPGAELGVVIHPALLGAMGRRMLFEGEIPQAYDAQGNAVADGSTRFTLASVGSDESGLLRARSTLWQSDGLCGAADVSASIGVSAGPRGVTLALGDVEVSNGRGSGRLLEHADDLAGSYLDALLETLSVTINYDAILAGERGTPAEVETFQLNVDGRGISLYLDLVD